MDEQSLEELEVELSILIRRVTHTSSHKKTSSLDRSAYLLLHEIVTAGPAGVKALAIEFQLDVSTVSRQAAALEQKGYLLRIPDETDGRAYTLQITETGLEEFQKEKKFRKSRVAEVTKVWTEEERETFAKLLKKYNQSAMNVHL
ncbi:MULTISPECIES: MarR family winged helix-turn-helix transcriptional regulator [Niallia]|jgi:DNA-binding MarR family transcriptional regulator|uniref:MarR family winged helix-turn-helix transcriptional regulator n=1 Tax=Niallia TaxID=2837506 RepID=UPI000F456289|nr:MarR family transcriptional regulator [Niallia circulans]AYV68113.1 MarR family transcriptional regulator [Niallia circulans]AYV73507.1 MarR family transcriptional regulator [Niallia circulans]NRG25978.1 MarR family transcriptional regulator [Niallia circulans]QJX64025.1 MarR family transcriptional regulator [Niallia circulans]UQZ75825.1 MarR family transcriptional regulator [Niallia circulans]